MKNETPEIVLIIVVILLFSKSIPIAEQRVTSEKIKAEPVDV